MFRSRLYWKVLANFGLLLLILAAMTVLTLNLLSQIESNFASSAADTRALATLDRIRTLLNDIPTAAFRYALMGEAEGKGNYYQSWGDLADELTTYSDQFADSTGKIELQKVRESSNAWRQSTGDKLINFGDERLMKGASRDLEARLQVLVTTDAKVRQLSSARSIVGKIYLLRMPAQLRTLDVATRLSARINEFVIVINVLLAIFSVALGFVLTRSITTPIRLLKGGTQNIMAGKFEPINLSRSDELGDLAADFNKMSEILGNNYGRLNAYSELVTTLNSSASMEDVQRKGLEILCKHTHAAIGALYMVVRGERALQLVSGYALRKHGGLDKRLAFGEGIPGQCAAEVKTLEVENISPASGLVIDTGLGELVPSHVMAFPVMFQEEILGVLVLGSAGKFGELEKDIVNNSVPQLGVALTNALNVEETRSLSVEIAQRNEELDTKNKEIEKAYKVKSDFLSSMSHELRTPLNSIIGFSSVLLGPSGDPLTPDQRMALEKVLKNGKHLLQLINDILDISKLESGRMMLSVESEDIATLLSNCILIVEPLVQSKHLTITQDFAPDLPTLSTDIVKVRQILVNLLSNAAKFTETGGISIKATRQPSDMISIAVKDTGIGIAEKDYSKVFEEFQQVDSSNTRKYKGTGLGMPIAKKLARMLGGDLFLESVVGKGSTFTLTIPAKLPQYLIDAQAQPAPAVMRPEPAKPRPAPVIPLAIPKAAPGQVQILSIDDDPDVIEILRQYLVPEGYSIVGALSGDEGIALAESVQPSLITLDIMMPRKDGWQTLRELKQNPKTKDIPVIIHSIVDNRPLALSLGAVDVMTKPTDPKRLLTLVQKYYQSGDQYILLVDDNLDFALACKNLLKQDGFNVKIATRGEEAIKILNESVPSLMLLDLIMPGMNGFAVIKELQKKEEWKKIPIVVLTGKTLTDADVKELDPYVADYLMKDSFTTAAISNAIRKIINVVPSSSS
jgi:signal transduction histidine kinase/DNA-binding response OmpR family regulator/CHASE3 domain sensor protein